MERGKEGSDADAAMALREEPELDKLRASLETLTAELGKSKP